VGGRAVLLSFGLVAPACERFVVEERIGDVPIRVESLQCADQVLANDQG
jgi:hypothetical protein